MNTIQTKKTLKETLPSFAPLMGLIVMIIFYVVVGILRDCNLVYGLKTILNESISVGLVASGAVFIFALGSFDISLGVAMGTSALLSAMVYNATESLWLMFLTSVVVAVLIGFVNSALASVFNLPVFVTTVAMMSILGAVMLILIGVNGTGDYIKVKPKAVAPLDSIPFKIAVLVAYLALCFFIFHLLKVGRQEKFIGGNPACAKLSGVPEKKVSIIAFVVSGLGMGLGAFMTIIYSPTLSANTGGSVGMDVIMAIVFGGMPISGGHRSKVFSAVIGAFSLSLLGQTMTFLNFSSGVGQMIKAAIFLLIVFISSMGYRGKLLPR